MKMNRIEVLEKEEVGLIHQKTLELLEKVGVKIESEEARNLLKENGAEVNNNTENVKFPRDLILEQLKKVPNHFTLYGSDGTFKFDINTNSVNFATVGTPVKIYDPSKKKGYVKRN